MNMYIFRWFAFIYECGSEFKTQFHMTMDELPLNWHEIFFAY